MITKKLQIVKEIFILFLGSFIFAFGINYFAISNKLSEGGFTGISLLLYYTLGISPGLVIFLLNLPLFFIGYKIFGKRSFLYTLIGTSSVSIALTLTHGWGKPIAGDPLLAALYTGCFVGIGLGLIFRVGGTTGGSDILARLGQKYLDWSVGRTIFLFDVLVIGISTFYIGREKAMYTVVAVFVGARVLDFVVEGIDSAKAVTIISHQTPLLCQEIQQKMGRGITLLSGFGGFTGQEKQVLYTVINRTELLRLKQLVHSIDPMAFVVIHDVRDVHGEGFTYVKPHE